LVENKTIEFDDWPLELGPKILLVPKHKRYKLLFVQIVVVLPSNSRILRAIEASLFIFKWKMITQSLDVLTN